MYWVKVLGHRRENITRNRKDLEMSIVAMALLFDPIYTFLKMVIWVAEVLTGSPLTA